MRQMVIEWDGNHLPSELRELPPGRYVITVVEDDEELTPEEEAGLLHALEQADRGEGIPLDEVMREFRERIAQR